MSSSAISSILTFSLLKLSQLDVPPCPRLCVSVVCLVWLVLPTKQHKRYGWRRLDWTGRKRQVSSDFGSSNLSEGALARLMRPHLLQSPKFAKFQSGFRPRLVLYRDNTVARWERCLFNSRYMYEADDCACNVRYKSPLWAASEIVNLV